MVWSYTGKQFDFEGTIVVTLQKKRFNTLLSSLAFCLQTYFATFY